MHPRATTSAEPPPLGAAGAEPLTEASFALRRRASDLRLTERADRPRISGYAPEAASVASPSAVPAGKSRTSKRNAASGKASPRSRAVSHSPQPVPAEDRAIGAPASISIGVISDNHGYLDPAVLEHFAGVVHIIHAGDIMDPAILAQLRTVAPVTAVAGNMDSGKLGSSLPREVAGEVAGVRFVVGHKRKRLLRELAAGAIEGVTEDAPPDLVVYGHDHVPAAAWVDGTLYLDPGSASAPHEEDDGPTVAIVEVTSGGLAVCFVPLKRRDMEETGHSNASGSRSARQLHRGAADSVLETAPFRGS